MLETQLLIEAFVNTDSVFMKHSSSSMDFFTEGTLKFNHYQSTFW